MSSTPQRGRPRSTAARQAVIAAARAMIEEGGAPSVTIDRLAERAGVGKPTIYRTWSNRHEVVMAALMAELPAAPVEQHAGSAIAALRQQLRRMVDLFSSPAGRGISNLLATAEGDTEIARAFRTHFLEARRGDGRRLIEAGIERGEIRSGIDIDVALDLLYAPVFYRILLRTGPFDAAWVDLVIDHLFAGMGGPRS